MTPEEMQARYDRAKELYSHYYSDEDLAEALSIFESLDDYENAASFAKRTAILKSYIPGKTVSYGSYNGEPIRWVVKDVRGKMRLLISEGIVARGPYQDPRVDTWWSTSSLRAWLNGPFLKEAFSPMERMAIMQTRISNPSSETCATFGGPDTGDKLFVPSPAEAMKYFPEQADRALGEWWWLRCPGSNLLSTVGMYSDGTLYEVGIRVNYELGGIRPAMWVLLKV